MKDSTTLWRQIFHQLRPFAEIPKLCTQTAIKNILSHKPVTVILRVPTDSNISTNVKTVTVENVSSTVSRVHNLTSPILPIFDNIKPLVQNFMSGTDGLILTYGPTCSGKRFSIVGDSVLREGLLTYSVQYILDNVSLVPFLSSFELSCCFFQIYLEQIFDTLSIDSNKEENLKIEENPRGNIYIKDLTWKSFSDVGSLNDIVFGGFQKVSIRQTSMSQLSRRGFYYIGIRLTSKIDNKDRTSFLWFVIGAGAERIARVGQPQRLKEAAFINKGLSSLDNVIYALAEKKPHVPFRDSKVTRCLTTVLSSNAPVAVLVSIPARYELDSARRMLRFANIAMQLKPKTQ